MENANVILVVFVIFLLYLYCTHNTKPRCKKNIRRNYRTEFMSDDIKYDDYNDFVLTNGLEQSVIDSHKKFADELQNKTSGSSKNTVFSHDIEVGPTWVGIRRPEYIVPIDPTAREVPSVRESDFPKNKRYTNGLY